MPSDCMGLILIYINEKKNTTITWGFQIRCFFKNYANF